MTRAIHPAPSWRHTTPGRLPGPVPWLLVALCGLIPDSLAATQVMVDRLSLVLSVAPGEPRLGVFTIRNDADTTVQAVIRLEDWDRAEDGTNRWYPVGTLEGTCGAALEIFPPTVTLEPGMTQAIRITFAPDISLARECWTAAIVETAAPPPSAGTGIGSLLRTATKIYVVPPGVASAGEVTSLGITRMQHQGESIPAVEVGFTNTGGLHLEGKGQVQIRTPDNTVLHTIDLPVAYVLPGARSRVRAPIPGLPAGRYLLLAIVDYGGAELAAGQTEHFVP